jgi:hypothetical protein
MTLKGLQILDIHLHEIVGHDVFEQGHSLKPLFTLSNHLSASTNSVKYEVVT